MIQKLYQQLYDWVWLRDPAALPRWRQVVLRLIRFVWTVTRDLADGQLTLRAMSLVYTTLLALVPLLAFSFALLKAFGAHNQLEPVLNRILLPLGDRGSEIATVIVGFVDNVRVGLLGSLGLILLLYTVISLVQKIEDGFNYAWRVPQARSLMRRFSGYMSVLTIGPLLVFGAIGILSVARSQAAVVWVLENEAFGPLVGLATRFVPVVMLSLAFTLFYLLVPNTRVRIVPALIGGLIAGILWELVGTWFATFVVSSARYTAVYASFAAPFLFMFWLYLSWMILLIGAQIAYYAQNPQYIVPRRDPMRLDHALKEKLALSVMYVIARDFGESGAKWTMNGLSRELRINADPLDTVVRRLLDAGLLMTTGDEGDCYAPGRDPGAITLHQIVDAMRHGGSLDDYRLSNPGPIDVVDEVQIEVEAAIAGALGTRTLRELVTP
ncbi:MAG: YhjD/YihY/BrkB family envelope integrity protein [Gammaproteobacteria bacterium]